MRTTVIPAIFLVLVVAACGGTSTGAVGAVAPSADPTVAVTPAPTVSPTGPPATPAAPQTPTTAPSPLCPAADEGSFDANQIVPATANIFGAGHELAPAPGRGGYGSLPPVWVLPAGTGAVTITCAMGTVIPIREEDKENGPAGDHAGRATDINSYGGISGIVHATNGMFLTGVFLTDAEPVDPAPERLDFTETEAFESLAPELGQTFFVGDGVGRRFAVPDGATRLFLGFADAGGYKGDPGWYGNNSGYLDVTVAAGE
jgi:hypothetical protein